MINLWCTKNLVDSQFLLGKILSDAEDMLYSTDPYDPDVELVFLNTCWFISSWREEALSTVNKLLQKNKKVCITWCAVKYRQDLTDSADSQRKAIKPHISILTRHEIDQLFLTATPRALTNIDQGFEYLKIAEWCDNSCSFCIIPLIRWKQQSLPIEKVVSSAENLIQQWAKEIILIAQDSTRYGTDLYGKPQLFELLEQIEQIDVDFKYRVLYLYPDLLTQKQLEKLTTFSKFIPYFDIPLQHISSTLLKNMGRFYDGPAIYQFLDFIQTSFPVHFIRTNFIIWFPGETDQDVQLLHDFIAKDYFDNIALFEYHDEPLAASSKLPNKIDEKLIHTRFTAFRRQVNQLLLSREHLRKWEKETWFIQEISPQTISVRPRLHCPEIDEIDDISPAQILTIEWKEIKVWSKITYLV